MRTQSMRSMHGVNPTEGGTQQGRRSMRSMRSMRWDLFSVIGGPCKRYAVTLPRTRMPVHGHGHGHGVFTQSTTASRGRTRLLL
jgi:hypothetical protein